MPGERLGDLGGQCCWGGSLFCWGVGGESGNSHTPPAGVVVSDSVSIAHIRLASVVSPVNGLRCVLIQRGPSSLARFGRWPIGGAINCAACRQRGLNGGVHERVVDRPDGR